MGCMTRKYTPFLHFSSFFLPLLRIFFLIFVYVYKKSSNFASTSYKNKKNYTIIYYYLNESF